MININEYFIRVKEDEHIQKMTNKATQSFRTALTAEEIQSCIMSGLWKAILKYDPEKNVKFTTYLYRGVRLECMTYIKQKYGNHDTVSASYYPIEDNTADYLDLLEVIETDQYADIVKDRLINKMTLREIAKKNHISQETVRIRLRKSRENLRKKLTSRV